MKRSLASISISLFLLFPLLSFDPVYAALFEDDHSIEDIVKAIQTPLSKEELSRARDMDDQLLATGDFGGVKGYLVTDPKYTGLTASVVEKLLRAMGEDTGKWVIRIVDTNPPMVNAFVTGGMYVYVFKPLLDQGTSEDELAFILAHELGHSYLHHGSRQEDSDTQVLANIADLIALAIGGQKGLQKSKNITQAFRGAFSQTSEMEADTFAAVLANRAGYDPVRGADFFTRHSRQTDEYFQARTQELKAERVQVDQAMAYCQQYQQVFEVRRTYQDQDNMQRVCADSENRRLTYNAKVEEFEVQQQSAESSIYSSHPANQDRVAFIVAVTDHLDGKRDLPSLKENYNQAFKTLSALLQVESLLLKTTVNETVTQTPVMTESKKEPLGSGSGGVKDKLRKLKELYEEELITEEEYGKKKQELLEQL